MISNQFTYNRLSHNEAGSQSQTFINQSSIAFKTQSQKITNENSQSLLSHKRVFSPLSIQQPQLAKRKLCQYYSKNSFCTKGNNCIFLHEDSQSSFKLNKPIPNLTEMNSARNYKRDLCKYYVSGKCLKGEKCTFSHNYSDFPCKYYTVKGICNNVERCRYFHRTLSRDEMFKFFKDNEQFIIDNEGFRNEETNYHFKLYIADKSKPLCNMTFTKQSNPHQSMEMNQINQAWKNINMIQNMYQIQQSQRTMVALNPICFIPHINYPMLLYTIQNGFNPFISFHNQNQLIFQHNIQSQPTVRNSFSKFPMKTIEKDNFKNNIEEIQVNTNDAMLESKLSLKGDNCINDDINHITQGIKEESKEYNEKPNNEAYEILEKISNGIKKVKPVDSKLK